LEKENEYKEKNSKKERKNERSDNNKKLRGF
jgi:hypothetical protein